MDLGPGDINGMGKLWAQTSNGRKQGRISVELLLGLFVQRRNKGFAGKMEGTSGVTGVNTRINGL